MVCDGPRTTVSSPSVSIRATSMPSMDVPLIRPTARSVLLMTSPWACPQTCSGRPSSCMFRLPCSPYPRSPLRSNHELPPMATYKSDFLNVLDERGFIHQCSDFAGLDTLAAKGEVVAYVGYDCTAPSLHIGNL